MTGRAGTAVGGAGAAATGGRTGAVIVVYADLLARRMFSPTELPVGVLTAVIGAPYLLWLLARANKIGTGG